MKKITMEFQSSKTEKKILKKILNKIIKRELNMFQRVRTAEPSLCQEHPDTFLLMREMGHSVLSLKTLKSYLKDLKRAKSSNRNLLTEKYARMNNIIPPLKSNPLIRKIVSIEIGWIKELANQYPLSIKNRSIYFTTYLSCELETYSDNTLNLYYNDVFKAKKSGINLAEKRFSYLFKKLGYDSIKDFENKLSWNK